MFLYSKVSQYILKLMNQGFGEIFIIPKGELTLQLAAKNNNLISA